MYLGLHPAFAENAAAKIKMHAVYLKDDEEGGGADAHDAHDADGGEGGGGDDDGGDENAGS